MSYSILFNINSDERGQKCRDLETALTRIEGLRLTSLKKTQAIGLNSLFYREIYLAKIEQVGSKPNEDVIETVQTATHSIANHDVSITAYRVSDQSDWINPRTLAPLTSLELSELLERKRETNQFSISDRPSVSCRF